jgi:glycosyltransferase involved in cell wall biosynthesis
MNKIAVNMIIGERPEMFLEYSLLSTKWADEHVIVNTGSKDNHNIAIAKTILPNAKFIDFSETGLPFTFSNARNCAIDHTESYWILWQDADEVHFDSLERLMREVLNWTHYDGFQFNFYHFLLDMFHFQHTELRKNVFKREGRRWTGNVHEHVEPLDKALILDYYYHHYGYAKPQDLIYENWRKYWELNPDENFKLKENRNPHDIISDRVTIAQDYKGLYPEVIKSYIATCKPLVKDYKFV